MIKQFNYDFFDFFGFLIGIFAFLTVFFISQRLLSRHRLNHRLIFYVVMLSLIFHFGGAVGNYWYSIIKGSDSLSYFQDNLNGNGILGYFFVMRLLNILKLYILGNSLLGAFLLFGAIGFIGSLFYFLTFKVLFDRLNHQEKIHSLNAKSLWLPAIILLCWPSFCFWSAAVKDSIAFLSISILLYVFAQQKINLYYFILFLLAGVLGFLVRPYLFVIFLTTFCIYLLFMNQWSLIKKTSAILLFIILLKIMMPALQSYSTIVHFNGSIGDIAKYALHQQESMIKYGSSIPMPTRNPQLLLLFLPYLLLANLLFPLGIFAKDFLSILSSVENFGLLLLLIFFFKNRPLWLHLKQIVNILKFYFLYFLIGMTFLSMMCTNLGLAMREKIMFVPALLICICVLYSYKKTQAS